MNFIIIIARSADELNKDLLSANVALAKSFWFGNFKVVLAFSKKPDFKFDYLDEVEICFVDSIGNSAAENRQNALKFIRSIYPQTLGHTIFIDSDMLMTPYLFHAIQRNSNAKLLTYDRIDLREDRVKYRGMGSCDRQVKKLFGSFVISNTLVSFDYPVTQSMEEQWYLYELRRKIDPKYISYSSDPAILHLDVVSLFSSAKRLLSGKRLIGFWEGCFYIRPNLYSLSFFRIFSKECTALLLIAFILIVFSLGPGIYMLVALPLVISSRYRSIGLLASLVRFLFAKEMKRR